MGFSCIVRLHVQICITVSQKSSSIIDSISYIANTYRVTSFQARGRSYSGHRRKGKYQDVLDGRHVMLMENIYMKMADDCEVLNNNMKNYGEEIDSTSKSLWKRESLYHQTTY